MAAGGEKSDEPGNAGGEGSECCVVARHTKKACHCCRGGGHGKESLEEVKPRRTSAGKTCGGY